MQQSQAGVKPITILSVHSNDLPCPACSYGVAHTVLNELDFCDGPLGCGHYHLEVECPITRVIV